MGWYTPFTLGRGNEKDLQLQACSTGKAFLSNCNLHGSTSAFVFQAPFTITSPVLVPYYFTVSVLPGQCHLGKGMVQEAAYAKDMLVDRVASPPCIWKEESFPMENDEANEKAEAYRIGFQQKIIICFLANTEST